MALVLATLSLTAACGSGGGGDTAGELTASPGDISSAATFSCTSPNSPTDCGFAEQAKVAGRASIVNIGRVGPTAVRLHTEPGDSYVAGSGINERDDLTLSQSETGCYEGADQWWAHSILFPNDYVSPPPSGANGAWNWGVVADFHQTGTANGVTFAIEAMPDTAGSPGWPTGLTLSGAAGDPVNPVKYSASIAPIVVRNVWYDFVYHVKWSSAGDGFFDVWVNGVRKLSYTGPTLYTGQGCYLKLANYHVPFGRASSVIHDRVIRGTTALAVAPGPLQGVLQLVGGVLTPIP